jgi:TonB family protein
MGVLGRAASDFPNSGLALFHFGSLDNRTPDGLELQVRALQRATELLPRFGRAYGQLGRVHTLTGKPEAALADLDRALELEPEFADEYALIRAEALLAMNRYGDANAAARLAAALPHSDRTTDYDFRSTEMSRHIEEVRRDVEGRRLQQIRAEVDALVARRDPPPPPPPPPAPPRAGQVEYSVQSNRQLRVVNSPLPVYANSLIQRGSAGKITVRVTIGTDGKVTQASVVDSQLQEMNVATVDATKKWVFGAITGSPAEARITFTFTVQ